MVVLIKVGGYIGAVPTVGLVLLTAMMGLALLRQQGLAAIVKAQQKMDSGEIPLNEMLAGIFLAVGGALLLTPGFVTDAIGFCCLIPGLRKILIAWGIRSFKPHIVSYRREGYPQSGGAKSHITIEGEYKKDDHPA